MTARRMLGSLIVSLAMTATIAATTLASHHLPDEGTSQPQATPKPRIMVIKPKDHVMLVGGTRRLDAQICNENGKGCKDAGRKAKWKVKPRNGLALSRNAGPSASVTGEKAGEYTVTVTQGKTKGSATVKINEPPDREPVEVAAMRLVSVPEHPVVAAGHPYAMSFFMCPIGITAETVTDQTSAGFRPMAADGSEPPGVNMLEVERLLIEAGCDPARLTTLEADSGFEVLHERGHQLLLYKADDAEGFSVRIVAESGEALLPSDKAAYFGSDAVDEADMPGLEGVDLAAIDREYLEQFGIEDFDRFDINGDGTLSVADILAFRDTRERLYADDAGDIDLDSAEQDRLEGSLDIDGDGVPDTDADEVLLKGALGEMMLDLLMLETPGNC